MSDEEEPRGPDETDSKYVSDIQNKLYSKVLPILDRYLNHKQKQST